MYLLCIFPSAKSGVTVSKDHDTGSPSPSPDQIRPDQTRSDKTGSDQPDQTDFASSAEKGYGLAGKIAH